MEISWAWIWIQFIIIYFLYHQLKIILGFDHFQPNYNEMIVSWPFVHIKIWAALRVLAHMWF